MTKFKCLCAALLLSLISTPLAHAEDDFQYWSQYLFKVVDTKKVDLSLFTEARFYEDANDIGLYLFSPKVSFDYFENLSFGLNYTYIQNKTNNKVAGRSELKFQHRAEVEINPHWDIGNFAKFTNRNRVEFRWIEDKGSYNTRSRHNLGFTFPLSDKKFLENIFISSEFFYNWAENAYDENRSIPIGLSFKLNDKTSLKAYYMIQSKRGSNDDWSANEILGTQLTMKF